MFPVQAAMVISSRRSISSQDPSATPKTSCSRIVCSRCSATCQGQPEGCRCCGGIKNVPNTRGSRTYRCCCAVRTPDPSHFARTFRNRFHPADNSFICDSSSDSKQSPVNTVSDQEFKGGSSYRSGRSHPPAEPEYVEAGQSGHCATWFDDTQVIRSSCDLRTGRRSTNPDCCLICSWGQ